MSTDPSPPSEASPRGALREHLARTVPEVADGTRRPVVMIAAFEGWNDAGEAATSAIATLAAQWDAVRLSPVCEGDYYDFQVNRPVISRGPSGESSLRWPGVDVHRAVLDDDGRPVSGEGEGLPPAEGLEVVLAAGVEPSVRWQAFVAELLTMAEQRHVDAVIPLGALLADVPHTRPLPARPSTAQPELQELLDADVPRYEGATGIVGVLAHTAALAGKPTVSVWVSVPHYVAQSPSPKARLALVQQVEDLLCAPLDTHELAEDAQAWERGVDELSGENPDVAAYVRQLEAAQDAETLPEASGERIAREFERYLRRRDGEA